MTHAGRSRAGFIPELDGLRAIAIILVFLHHSRAQLPVVNMTTFYLGWYFGQGWMGVDLFFVLSGFLITGILLETRETSNYFTGFYARRVLRIFPLYYLVLTAVIVGGSLLNVPKITATLPVPQDRWLYFCYLMNWVGLWRGHFGANSIGHFWSLAVEEQFYLVWPLIVWMVRPRTVRGLPVDSLWWPRSVVCSGSRTAVRRSPLHGRPAAGWTSCLLARSALVFSATVSACGKFAHGFPGSRVWGLAHSSASILQCCFFQGARHRFSTAIRRLRIRWIARCCFSWNAADTFRWS